jgi:hypothetical protein
MRLLGIAALVVWLAVWFAAPKGEALPMEAASRWSVAAAGGDRAAVAWLERHPTKTSAPNYVLRRRPAAPHGDGEVELHVVLVDEHDARNQVLVRTLPEEPMQVRLADAGEGRFVLAVVNPDAERYAAEVAIDTIGRCGAERSYRWPLVRHGALIWLAAAGDEIALLEGPRVANPWNRAARQDEHDEYEGYEILHLLDDHGAWMHPTPVGGGLLGSGGGHVVLYTRYEDGEHLTIAPGRAAQQRFDVAPPSCFSNGQIVQEVIGESGAVEQRDWPPEVRAVVGFPSGWARLSRTWDTLCIDGSENGTCVIELPESLFDADYPGHYMRRLRSVSLTIPCTTGPYTGVNCKLTLLKSAVRKTTATTPQYAESPPGGDPRFRYDFASPRSIVTSSGQNDSGLFELNFRDERYLPFEGAGAISRWQIDLNHANNAFDISTVSDVVLHVRYTARDGGSDLAQVVPPPNWNGARLFSAKTEFPDAWYAFLNPASGSPTLTLPLQRNMLPFQAQQGTLTSSGATLFFVAKTDPPPSGMFTVHVDSPTQSSGSQTLLSTSYGDEVQGLALQPDDQLEGTWTVTVESIPAEPANGSSLNPDALDDVLLVYNYTLSP